MKTYANDTQRHDARRARRNARRRLARQTLDLMTPAERHAVLRLALSEGAGQFDDPKRDTWAALGRVGWDTAALVDDPAAWGLS